jgi:phytoene synthase
MRDEIKHNRSSSIIPSELAKSYAFCETLAKRQARNFYPAFRVLPAPQRRAMCALYAFMRVADDLTDEPGAIADKQAALANWRGDFDKCLEGIYRHPLHAALHHTLSTYEVPRKYLDGVLDGVEMDLFQECYATFSDLYQYCYRVASAVGLACIHIWGFRDERALAHAESAGIAFQLTNILRDLGEDATRGRIYVPQEDLLKFGYTPAALGRGERNEAYRSLMQFEIERARHYYATSQALSGFLQPGGRAIFRMLVKSYSGLLDAIEERDYDVFSRRVRLGRWRKFGLALQGLTARWGWA